MTTLIAICAAGLAGLVTVLTTASYYRGVDGPAFAITLVMGAALAAGVAELLWVSRRTTRLHDELNGLPTSDPGGNRREALDAASPLLRALLRARLDRTVLPVPGPVFSPYLVGLLIMLGLLGTFLGLFETLRGASTALNAGADVEALRAGLREPMQGLMRSFGTSAAGVASSAMLGLGAVFARRAAGQLGLSLHTLSSGALSKLSPAHRQLVALEALASQGEALPQAAAALGAATEQLQGLRDAWQQSHHEAATRTQQTLDSALSEVRDALGKAVDGAANAAGKAVAPIVERGLAKTVSAATEHLQSVRADLQSDAEARGNAHAAAVDALQARTEALASCFETADAERRTLAEAHQRTLTEGLDAHTAAVLEQLASHRDGLREAQARQLETLQGQAGAIVSQLGDHAGQQQAQQAALLTAQQTQQETLLAQHAAQHGELLERVEARSLALAQSETRLAEERQATWQQTHTLLQTAFGDAAERDQKRAQSFADAAEQMQRDLADAAGAVQERLDHGSQVEQAQQARADALLEAMQQTSTRIGEATGAQVENLQRFVEATDGHLRAAEEESRQRQQALMAQLSELATQQSAQLSELATQQSTQVTEVTEQQASRVTELLQQSAAQLDGMLRRQAEQLQAQTLAQAQQLQGLLSQAEAQQRAAQAELSAQQQALLDRLSETGEAQAQRLTEHAAQNARALDAARAETETRQAALLEQLAATATAQADSMAQFESALSEQHNKRTSALTELLGKHVTELDGAMQRSTGLLEEAAGLVHGGGAEMTAVAETFGAAVERQRQGVESWLSSLGDIERSVTDAGEAAAADVLGQHLARTHEVFDRQLRFQQELLEQLQSTGAPVADGLGAQVVDATA